MSKIALGAVQFGVDYGINSTNGKVPLKEVDGIISYARRKNIDLLDTAPAYGDSEQVLGNANVQEFKIVTKTRHFDSASISNKETELMRRDFSHSLTNLKQDSVYGVLIHNANDLLKPGSKKLFDQLEMLKQEGKVEKIGVSVYDYEQLHTILESFDIDLVQLPFNILDKRLVDNGTFDTLKNKGVEVHARSVFLQGLLLMDKHKRPNKFKRWDALWKVWHDWLFDNQITALEATIRHAISVSEISKVLVGVDSTNQLREIVAASHGGLPEIPPELFTNDVDLLNPSHWGEL